MFSVKLHSSSPNTFTFMTWSLLENTLGVGQYDLQHFHIDKVKLNPLPQSKEEFIHGFVINVSFLKLWKQLLRKRVVPMVVALQPINTRIETTSLTYWLFYSVYSFECIV